MYQRALKRGLDCPISGESGKRAAGRSAVDPMRTLQRNQQRDRLDRIVAAINVIPHEEIICVWAGPADAENLNQVMELRVDVATYDDGRRDVEDIWFVQQHFARLGMRATGGLSTQSPADPR